MLGDQIDLHTGGEDNIFPHHECEIAQSESVTQKKPFVRYWLHRRRITISGGTLRQAQGDMADGDDTIVTTMSKSLGNVLSITDIIAKGFDAMDIRYYLLSVHYRTNLKFSWEGMDAAHGARRSIMEWMEHSGRGVYASIGKFPEDPKTDDIRKYEDAFRMAMDDDLNVSAALAVVFECMNYMNSHAIPTEDAQRAVSQFIFLIRSTFGCFDPVEVVIPKGILALRDKREKARAEKNFAESDRLRAAIEAQGYEIRDQQGKPAEIRKK